MVLIDRSTAFPSHGMSIEVMPANSARRFLLLSYAGNGGVYVNVTGAPATREEGSILIQPGDRLHFQGDTTPLEAVTAMSVGSIGGIIAVEGQPE